MPNDLSKDLVSTVLASVGDPAGGTMATASRVSKISACDGYVHVQLRADGLTEPQCQAAGRAAEGAIRDLAAREGAKLLGLKIEFAGAQPPRSVPLQQAGKPAGQAGNAGASAQAAGPASQQSSAPSIPGVKHVIAVGAGKGGVGKSTVAVNLAVGLALRGHSVGLLDGDIYGPSLPTMLGLDAMQTNVIGNMLQPFLVHGVKAMTIGKLVDPEKPLIWRGPMAHGAFKQLVEQTQWGELDYLIIDLPPGTGDVSLTLAQLLKLTGAVVVCTPQTVAQDDAVRAARMFQQLGIEILGVVENMSYFVADDINPPREYDLFGRGGAEMMAQRLGLPFLGAIPITIALRKNSDAGDPSANFKGPTKLAQALDRVVANVEGQVALASMKVGAAGPKLTIS